MKIRNKEKENQIKIYNFLKIIQIMLKFNKENQVNIKNIILLMQTFLIYKKINKN